MPPLSRQARLEQIAQEIMIEVSRKWKNHCYPTEVILLSRLFSKRLIRIKLTMSAVLLALEGEGRLTILRTPSGKGWVLEKRCWDALAPVIRDTAIYRLDRVTELQKQLKDDTTRLKPDQVRSAMAELAHYARFD